MTDAPLRPYVRVLVTLLALTVVTTAVAYVDLGWANVPIALGIAAVKAALVALVFMHLRGSTGVTIAVAVSALLWLGILLGLTLSDYLTRSIMTFG